MNTSKSRTTEKQDIRENNQVHYKNPSDASFLTTAAGTMKTKRRAKGYVTSRRPLVDPVDRSVESDEVPGSLYCKNEMPLQDENVRTGMSFSRWEERVGTAELERAVLSLLEFGQISAAKQLQHKLSPAQVPTVLSMSSCCAGPTGSGSPWSGAFQPAMGILFSAPETRQCPRRGLKTVRMSKAAA